MTEIRHLMFYGGLTREQFDVVRSAAMQENLQSLKIYAPIGSVVFCVLLVASLLSGSVPASNNVTIYSWTCIAMGVVAVLANVFGGRGERVTYILMQAFMYTLYAFAIGVSMYHVEYPAVSAIVFLLVTPLLFICRPIAVTAQTCVAVLVICCATMSLKDPTIAGDDMWNAVSFGIVGVVVNIFLMRTKLTSLYQAHEITYMSETDRLTGLKNRNCYESRLEAYPQGDSKTLVCAYADADGLHELNNTKGHDAGDVMLCTIAYRMQDCFGEEHTYRIGGDEFVSFWPDGDEEEARRRLANMRQSLLAQGYVVSCGASSARTSDVNMRKLVRQAEKEMYEQKFSSGVGR